MTPLPREPAREATILALAAVVLTIVHFRGHVLGLDPSRALAAWIALHVVLLFAVPALVVRFVFRDPLTAWGVGVGAPRVWARDVALLAPLVLAAAYLLARIPAVRETYPIHRAVLAEPWLWLPTTLGWGAASFASEAFFRGFLLFGMARRLGPSAIFVQLVPFVMAHYPKSEAEALLAIPGGIALGLLAWRGRSCIGPWILALAGFDGRQRLRGDAALT